MTPLFVALHRWAVRPHEWGGFDCMLMLADWVAELRGFDPAADLRGTYGNPEFCPIGRRYRDNPEPVLRAAFMALPVTDTPAPGDIALVQLRGSPHLMGAVRVDARNWAMKPERGGLMVTRAVVPVVAWGLGYAP